MPKSRLILLFLGMLLLPFSCKKAEAVVEEHPFTETEQEKNSLDEVSTQVWESLGLEEGAEILPFLREHTRLIPSLSGLTIAVLSAEDEEVMRMKFGLGLGRIRLSGSMLDRVELNGTVGLDNFQRGEEPFSQRIIQAMDAGTDVAVHLDGKEIGRLGFEAIHENEAGKDSWTPVPVIRFKDGTSYSVSGLLLVAPLIEFFLRNGMAKA